jgi:YegS/Rv2252/BmrU family lipid kinase
LHGCAQGHPLVNTQARHGSVAYAAAKDLLLKRGVVLDAAYPVRDPARLPEVVRSALDAGCRLIVLGGGDGTLSSVVDMLAHREVALGLLPLGTANNFARTVGLPLSLEGAVDIVARGKVADVDLARVDHDLFANTAALGLSARVARATPAVLKRYLGTTAYLAVAAAQLFSHPSFQCRITSEGTTTSYQALQVVFANGRYYGGVLHAPETHVESRDVLAQIVVGSSRLTLLRAWLAVALGRPPDPSIVTELPIRDAMIEADPPQYVSIDGEVAARTPVRIAVVPEALALMVPPGFEDLD